MNNTGVPADPPAGSDQPSTPPGPPAPAAGAQPAFGPPPAAPWPPQAYPGAGQPFPGQPFPGHPFPGQPFPAQPFPGQPFTGQPGQPVPGQDWGPPPPPPPQWGPPPVPPAAPRRTARWVVPVVVVCVLAVFGCLFAVGASVMRASERASAQSEDRLNELFPELDPSGSATAPEDPLESETEPAGPRASTYPVREHDDLNRVCDGYYYPQSPKFAGRAPHQIAVGVIDRKDLPSRIVMSSVDVPYSLDEKAWRAWMPTDAAKTQLMVCVDLVSTGKQVRKCTYRDPDTEQIPLVRATYQVRLHEVATGRKLVDKKVAGNDDECPSMILLGSDRKIYTNVADRDLYEMFRSYVMKK